MEMTNVGNLLELRRIYSRGITGKGITTAVLDTGIYAHPDFFIPQNKILYFQETSERKLEKSKSAVKYDNYSHRDKCERCGSFQKHHRKENAQRSRACVTHEHLARRAVEPQISRKRHEHYHRKEHISRTTLCHHKCKWQKNRHDQ